jgi:kynurenine formamidase
MATAKPKFSANKANSRAASAKGKPAKSNSKASPKKAPKPKALKANSSSKAKLKATAKVSVKARSAAPPTVKLKARVAAPPKRSARPVSSAKSNANQRRRAPELRLPRHDQLPVREGAPAGAAWGVFGDDDQLGTINLLTPATVVEAAGSIRSGRTFALNLSIDIPNPPLFGRGKHNHVIKQYASYILDDYLDNFYPQASSQWDALCHVKHPKHGGYNGFPDSEITGYGGTKLGIDNLARRGIAGRGVLADIGRYHERHGRTLDFMTNEMIALEDLWETLREQKTELRPGDVLLVRIGWTKAYLAMSAVQREALAARTKSPGIEGTARTAKWLWDSRISAVASDSPALEAMPPPKTQDPLQSNDLLHFHMLSYFGMPIGEMWNLEELAEACAGDRHYDFFFTSAPLNIPGGVGSPPNAIAVK